MSLGAEWDINPARTLRGGIAKDQNPRRHAHPAPAGQSADRSARRRTTDAFSVDAAYQRINIKHPEHRCVHLARHGVDRQLSGHADLFGVSAQYRF